MNIRDSNNKIAFEFYLILSAFRLFGFIKMIRFIIGLPTVFFTRRNRSAYAFMGECKSMINGFQIRWKHPDVRFIDEIVSQSAYNPEEDFRIKDDFTVVDAGANVGAFTLYAAAHATNGKIYSIEPHPKDFQRLEENVNSNKCHNIITINAALSSDSNGVIFDNFMYRCIKTMEVKDKQNPNLCNSITINGLVEKYKINKIDFLKIDIEGFEFEVFTDLSWLDRVKRISMELHPFAGDVNQIIQNLRDKGFSVKTKVIDGISYCYAKK